SAGSAEVGRRLGFGSGGRNPSKRIISLPSYLDLPLAQLPPKCTTMCWHDTVPLARNYLGVIGVVRITDAPLHPICERNANVLAPHQQLEPRIMLTAPIFDVHRPEGSGAVSYQHRIMRSGDDPLLAGVPLSKAITTCL